MKFIDEARIEVIAGDGGDGSASMRRELRNTVGKTDGEARHTFPTGLAHIVEERLAKLKNLQIGRAHV